MVHTIEGTVAQSVSLTLGPEETAWAAKGTIIAHSGGLRWDVKVPGGMAGALKRSLSGAGIALTCIQGSGARPSVVLGANAPGHIEPWDLDSAGPVLTTRGAFLAAWGPTIDINVTMAKKPGAAIFGGAGLVLQRIDGRGTVLVHGRGDFRRTLLADGEQLLVSTGNLAAFSAGIDYDIQAVGSLRKTLFGKEGLFMTRLTGPGMVLLQTLKPGKDPQQG